MTTYKIEKQQGPTLEQENCVPYFVIIYNGKESEKKI